MRLRLLVGLLLCYFVSARYTSSVASEGGYVCAGNGFYVAGNQLGQFPEHGWHIPGQMSGVWMQPIKLLDSYSIKTYVKRNGVFTGMQWQAADQFEQFPFSSRFVFENGDCKLTRSETVIDQLGLSVQFQFNLSTEIEESYSLIQLEPNLRGAWLSEDHGEVDDQDVCSWKEKHQIFTCRDRTENRFLVLGLQTTQHSVPYSFSDSKISIDSDVPQALRAILDKEQEASGSNANKKVLLLLVPGGTINLYITGSTISKRDAIDKFLALQSQSGKRTEEKQKSYDELAVRVSVTVPDESLQLMYDWGKYNIAWLYNSIDELGSGLDVSVLLSSVFIVIGIFGGLPEYPMFFGCDTTYSVEGMLAIGMYEGK